MSRKETDHGEAQAEAPAEAKAEAPAEVIDPPASRLGNRAGLGNAAWRRTERGR